MADINRRTGEVIGGLQSALQSVEIIFTTRIGETVMLRHFGAGIAELLGRSMSRSLFAAFQMLIVAAIDVWEPRFRVQGVYPDVTSSSLVAGSAGIRIVVNYMPNGHHGDFAVQKQVEFSLMAFDSSLRVQL